jgi:L-cysteate sulfo-lyase
LRAGSFADDEDVIFVHTGGAAALFGYRWAFDAALA